MLNGRINGRGEGTLRIGIDKRKKEEFLEGKKNARKFAQIDSYMERNERRTK